MLILWDHTLRHFARKFNRKQMANVVGPHTQRRQGSKPRNKALEPEFLEQTKWPPPLCSVTGSNGWGGGAGLLQEQPQSLWPSGWAGT